jgi:hypothetical protein
MPWYARSGPRTRETGKFRAHSQLGTTKSHGEAYRNWSYHLVAHQTGSGVRRTKYSVSVCDPNHQRAAYLQDFCNLQQATTAAQQWIDQQLGRTLPAQQPGAVGTIPAAPHRR